MPTPTPPPLIADVSVNPQANVFFDGKCISHTLIAADGARKSVGVILPPASLTFNVGAPEVMETVAGTCEIRLPGDAAWRAIGPGDRFSVAAHTAFEIRVADAPYHYVCHFG